MRRKNGLNKIVKRTFAVALTTMTVAVSSFGGLNIIPPILDTEIEALAAPDVILSNEDRNAIFEGTRTDFRDESIYFAMVTRFYNGDESNDVQCWDGTQYNLNDPAWRGDFKGLIEKLDYIKALGFTAIWITPVVENCSGYDYHGYHALNFKKVDERYESDDVTYQDLINAVHDKGMKIIQDVVFNHTGNFGETNLLPMFEKEGDLSSPDCLKLAEGSLLPENYNELTPEQQYAARLALMKNTDGVDHDVNNLYHHYGTFNWDDYTCQIAQIAGDCVDLNTENPLVYNYLIDAYTKYINMGVDGFRVDTVRHISRLTFNKVFNNAFHEAAAKNGNDNFFMFGEVCTRDNGNYWYRNNPAMSTPFYTWKESKDYPWSDTDWEVNYESAIQCTKDNADNVSEQPTSDNAFLKGNDYHTPDYSDFSGLSVIDFPMHWSFKTAENAFSVAKRGDHTYNDATWNVTYVDSHDYAPDGAPEDKRFDQDQSTWAENLSLMFTFRGIPCIYYGTETEFQKGAPIDKGPNIALAESGRAYYGDNIEGEVTATGFASYGDVSGTVKDTLSYPLSQHIQRLNRLRQAVPALRKGQYSTEGVSGNLAFKRRYTDDKTDSFACVSISGNATFTGIPNGKYVDAVTGDVKNVTNGTLSVSVSGKGNIKCYVLDTSKTPAPGRVITNGTYLTDGGAAELIEYDKVNRIEVTGITLDKTEVSLLEAEEVKVTPTITPSNATTKTVKWTSSNTDIATVSGGKITGIAPGTATITATTNNGKTATVKVKVSLNPNIIKPTGITLSADSVSIVEGNSETVNATVLPSNATDKSVTWKSADSNVAKVDSRGKITAVTEGTTTITATTFNGYSALLTVVVKAKSMENIGPGVYFEKPSGWGENINVYLWDANENKLVGNWPGTAMTLVGDGIYGFSYEADASIVDGMQVIFNDGAGNQTSDLEYTQNGLYTIAGLKKVLTFEEKTEGTVIVRYVDENGVILSDNDMLTGTIGNEYTTYPKVIEGYTLKIRPSNEKGTYTADDIIVTYVYETKKGLSIEVVANNLLPNIGDKVTITAMAAGGSGDYTYKYTLHNVATNKWSNLTAYQSASSYDYIPSEEGTYELYVTVKDSEGAIATSKAVEITAEGTAALSIIAKANGSSSVDVATGTKVTIAAQALGGTGNYTYKYVLHNVTTNKWSNLTSYSSSTSYEYTPATSGKYEIFAVVKDSAGTVVTSEAVMVTVTDNEALTITVTGNGSSSVNVATGTKVTIETRASGGTGDYTYKYVLHNVTTNKWSNLTSYGSSTSYEYIPTVAGTYEVFAVVKDSAETVVTSKAINVTVKDGDALAITARANGSTTANVSTGTKVTIVSSATGGEGNYTYKYVLHNVKTNKWSNLTSYGSSTSYEYIPAVAGTYEIFAVVKDSVGTVVTSNAVTVTATEGSNVLAITAKVNGSTSANITTGTNVTMTGEASGGAGSYTYKFVLHNLSTNKWSNLTSYGNSASYIYKFSIAGLYEVFAVVKDSEATVKTSDAVKVIVN